ncbi:MAG TPA: questin oxidase family protein [Sphingobium sp.]|uniref:questin oxidase family protein n=1 Tax=Sphingobium sp. TaxID=1912891 RepID=UPI002ED3DAD7
MVDASAVADLLDDQSYHIEFNGHLTNHVKHAVVALAGLGASQARIRDYYETYATLTPYGYPLEPPRPSTLRIDEGNWQALIGQRKGFAAYVDFFERLEQRIGLVEVLRFALPELLPGWVGAFTHATIHLGWALDAGNRAMAIEGLAYMAYTYVSCHPERVRRDGGAGREGPVDSLLRIVALWEKDAKGRAELRLLLDDASAGERVGIHPELVRSGLQYRIAMMSSLGHPLIYDLPDWGADTDVEALWVDLYRAVTLLYLAKPGDFVLLHLVTSLHAVEQIARAQPSGNQRAAIELFWTGALAILFSEADFASSEKLTALRILFDRAPPDILGAGAEAEWDLVVGRALQEAEEHNPKLVYVLRLLWDRTGGETLFRHAAAQFTKTPDLPPSFAEPAHD